MLFSASSNQSSSAFSAGLCNPVSRHLFNYLTTSTVLQYFNNGYGPAGVCQLSEGPQWPLSATLVFGLNQPLVPSLTVPLFEMCSPPPPLQQLQATPDTVELNPPIRPKPRLVDGLEIPVKILVSFYFCCWPQRKSRGIHNGRTKLKDK